MASARRARGAAYVLACFIVLKCGLPGAHAESVSLHAAPACPDRAALSQALAALGLTLSVSAPPRKRVSVRHLGGARYLVALAGARGRRRIRAAGACTDRAIVLALAIERLLSPLPLPRRRVRARPRKLGPVRPPFVAPNHVARPREVPYVNASEARFLVAPELPELAPTYAQTALRMPNPNIPALESPPPLLPIVRRRRGSPTALPRWELALGALTQSGVSQALMPGAELAVRRLLAPRVHLEGRVAWRTQSVSEAAWRVTVDDWRLGFGAGYTLWRGLLLDALLGVRLRVVATQGELSTNGATNTSAFISAGLGYTWRFGAFGFGLSARALVFARAESIVVDGVERLAGDRAAVELSAALSWAF